RLNSTIKGVIGALERFEIHLAGRRIEEFVVDDLSNWYIRRSRRRFWVTEENFDKDCAYLTLYEVLVSLCKLLAPFVPFITEHIYQNIVRTISEDALDSVHLCDYPFPVESLVDVELEDSMDLISKLVEAGRRARSDAGIKIRQPLKEVVVICSKEKKEEVASLVEILKEELNVKEVKFEESLEDITAKAVAETLAEERKFKKVEVDDVSLFLDVTLDKSLIEEGLVRDLVRRVQGMRKDIDLEYTAKIRILYEGDEEIKEAINMFLDYICEETLAASVEEGMQISESKREGFYEKKWKIGKKEVLIGVEAV
ncbi:MAG: class I tRNA ligase family protein, partial [Euryarchaeota archaeon]|nr:class I tRNA ligase family protein [Euryarchaeota archaeon]